jgi:hypothetical protein
MAERYLHSEVKICQTSRKGKQACGDVVSVIRQENTTTIILCDGVGSGVSAHIASTLCKSRLETLLAGGFSMHEAFLSVAGNMEQWKQPGKPYAAFLVAQIRSDGYASAIGYEIPAPVWVTPQQAAMLPSHAFMEDSITGWQVNCFLRSGETLVFLTDGITQAGLGAGLISGWQTKGVTDYINSLLKRNVPTADIGRHVHQKASEYDNGGRHDDMTVVTAMCRYGRTLNIFTGPPADRKKDPQVVRQFMDAPGAKVVCGATTAAITAGILSTELKMEQDQASLITPPKYLIRGIDLVTEGAVTLNQLNNVLDLPADDFDEINAVTELYDLLMGADRIRFFLGTGKNPANSSVCFVQRGVLSREKIVPLIAEKLRRKDKCVLIHTV